MSNGKTNIIYPPQGRVMLDGGLSNKYSRALIADNESPDCQNVVFTNGAAETRGGYTKLNTTAVGSFVCDGLYTRRANTGAETMVAFFGGSAWQLATTTFSTISSAQSVFTAGVRVCGAQYQQHLFVGNGYVTPYKYNGTDFTRHGVIAPTTTATVASSASGTNLAGVYSWKITFVNSQAVEGNGGPAITFTVTSTGGQANLTSIPVAPQSHGINSRRIYRTDAGGSTYRRVATISDNTTTTYGDNIASASVGATMPADAGEPPTYSAIIYHANRLFCNDASNPNYVWYSDLTTPYTFASTNFDTFGDNALDLVKGFAVYDNALIVFCENSEWLWYMGSTSTSDWQKVQIRSSYGSKSPFGSVRYENKILFPAYQNSKFVGFAAIQGDAVAPSATLLTVSAVGSDMQSDKIEPDIFTVNESYLPNITGIVYKNKAYMSVTYDTATTNNKVYVFDFSISNLGRKSPAWVPYKTVPAAQFTIYAGYLYFGSAIADGFVHKLETSTYSDNGTAIDSYLWTKEFSGCKGHENLEKDFRFLYLLVDKSGSYHMSVRYRVDSDSGDGTETLIDLTPGGGVWGTGIWGTMIWGSGSAQEEIAVPLAQARGKRIQFKFANQNTASQKFKVYGLKYTYNIRGQR